MNDMTRRNFVSLTAGTAAVAALGASAALADEAAEEEAAEEVAEDAAPAGDVLEADVVIAGAGAVPVA